MNDKTMEYKGFTGSADYSQADGLYHGKVLGISDLVTFQATAVGKLRFAFMHAVNDYIETCEALGKDSKPVN